MGDIYGAERLIPVKSVQVAGVSFRNIGEAGLEWISDLKGHVVVPSILNPAGMDLRRWNNMGIDEEFASKQMKVIEAYERLGIFAACTCTPYQINSCLANRNDHLAWSESSAVSYANSVIGACTNREGGPSALAAALVGKTPLYGYHLDENRKPTHEIFVDMELNGSSDFGALGYLIGKIVKAGNPSIHLNKMPDTDELKALGAAMAASGSIALYYIKRITTSPSKYSGFNETISLDKKDIDSVFEKSVGLDADIVALGCPHCSHSELAQIGKMLEGKKICRDLWICTARQIAETNSDLVEKIERSGAKVICDTCMVVSPATDHYKKMITNSGKALVYLPTLCNVEAGLASMEECIRCATEE
ncbi:MAG: aconitase X catalytic domain-containing protein [Methanotrichaceae archaeon]|nr:aconitase X catalytic domain-containing protein [Methanotrichaceae archaeon]